MILIYITVFIVSILLIYMGYKYFTLNNVSKNNTTKENTPALVEYTVILGTKEGQSLSSVFSSGQNSIVTYVSPNGKYQLQKQADNNYVLTRLIDNTVLWSVGGGFSILDLNTGNSYNYRITSQELLAEDRDNAKAGDLWFNGWNSAGSRFSQLVIKVANGPQVRNTPYEFILNDKGFLGLVDKDGNKYATLYPGEQ
jgi:hypothetical protein